MRSAVRNNLTQFFNAWRIMMLTDDDLSYWGQKELQIASPLSGVVAPIALDDAPIENS
jgi:hypothetical protein